ncbi:MAG: flagellar type III secretion system pore protein FliP [Pseudomonadota bacterium]
MNRRLLFALVLGGLPSAVSANVAIPIDAAASSPLTLSVEVLIGMTLLTVLPALLLSMSSFVRIVIVLSILRQALGTAQTPPNQLLIGIALFLTFFIMHPVLNDVYVNAAQPYINGDLGFREAVTAGLEPMRSFMLAQTRETDLAMFVGIAGDETYADLSDVPTTIVIPSFIVSELKTAFQIGFMVFVPFLVIDLVVSSVLMSMGMMMLSPMLISLPFKIMLFALVDGWSMLIGTLAASFYV